MEMNVLFGDLEAVQIVRQKTVDIDREIINRTAGRAFEMAMILHHDINTRFILLNRQDTDQFGFNKEIQRIVDGRFGQRRNRVAQCAENLIHRGVALVFNQIFQDHYALMRWVDAVFLQLLYVQIVCSHHNLLLSRQIIIDIIL